MREEGYELNFCGTTWWLKETTPVDDDGSDGETDFNHQVISINSELHSHRKALAVVHEMLHVVCDSVGIQDDEEMIRGLEHGVLSIINAFPEEYKNK